MIECERKKRDFAFIVLALLLFVFLLISAAWLFDIYNGAISFETLRWIGNIIQLVGTFFMFKAFYHWAKAKGYSGIHALWGMLGVIGLIVLYYKPDKTVSPLLLAKQEEEDKRRQWTAVDKFD